MNDTPTPRTDQKHEAICESWSNSVSSFPEMTEFAQQLERELTAVIEQLDCIRDTLAKMQYNHRYEREKMSRVIRRLVRYADRVAEKHPKAVTVNGQNARINGAMWLAQFDRENNNQPTEL